MTLPAVAYAQTKAQSSSGQKLSKGRMNGMRQTRLPFSRPPQRNTPAPLPPIETSL